MNRRGSAVISMMAKASYDAWRKWRQLVADGRGESAEAVEAWEQSQAAGAVMLDELAAREKLETSLAQRAA